MNSKVYVLLDDKNRILRIEGQYSLPSDLTGWILIEEGHPCDRLNLAQSHYLDGGLYTEDCILRWKLIDNIPTLRTDEELNADRTIVEQPDASPTLESRVGVLEIDNAETKEALEMILNGVTE